MIGQKFPKPCIEQADMDAYSEAARWCNQNGATIEDIGDHYEVVPIPPPPAPTPEQIRSALESAVDAFMDSEAQKLGYADIAHAVTYAGDEDPIFAAEGDAFKKWRSKCYRYCYDQIARFENGERGIPTAEELISELPELVIDYGDQA